VKQKKKLHSCRFCGSKLEELVVDLGMQPLCESYVSEDQLDAMEPFYPLKTYVCGDCFLVQVLDFVSGEDIYSHYAYFSSYSDSWLRHTEDYVNMAVERFDLDSDKQVIEIASNDGYLLQYMQAKGIPVLGIEPAANVAEVAIKKDIPTVVRFFGVETATSLADDGMRADLLVGNNVLAHVPDVNDFVEGLRILLNESGVISMEVPHLASMFEHNQFDTIYQEHYSYYSLVAVSRVFEAHGLTIFDVDQISTHGGSIRIYASHSGDESHEITSAVHDLRRRELESGFEDLSTYREFGEKVMETKRKLLSFLIQAKREGKQIVGYGAPGKGNTLLNYCGIRQDFIDYTVDRNPFKHGKYLPGTRIPVFAPDKIAETKPDYVLLLPWNLKEELLDQLEYVREWGGKFIVPIPEVEIL
jgi:2-polyprenyl-3-methyl-5-hydroxy-6-metoxy-1,4-benzoquinol methylase